MGVFDFFKRSKPTLQLGSVYFGSSLGLAGNELSKLEAYALATYAQCVEIISGTISSCPIEIKEKSTLGYVCNEDHYLSSFFRHVCNSDAMLFMDVLKTTIIDACNHGDGYAYIEKDPMTARVANLWPIPTPSVRLLRTPTNELVYFVQGTQSSYYLRPDELIHVKGRLTDGLQGQGSLSSNADAIRLGVDAQKFGANYFKNGANVGGMLTSTADMTPDARKQMVADFRKMFSGPDNAFKVGSLPKGIGFEPFDFKADTAQFVEMRKYQDLQIARAHGIPPAILGIIESGDKNTEQQGFNLYKFCLLPWITRIEAELETKLLFESEKAKTRIRLNVDNVLRADIKTRYEVAAIGRQWGLTSQNDFFAQEGKPLIQNGSEYLRPMNMTTDAADATEATAAAAGETGAAVGGLTAAPAPQAAEANVGQSARNLAVSAFAPIVKAEVERLLAKESNAMRSAFRRSGEADFKQWADLFYRQHQDLATEFFAPIAKTIAAATGAEERNAADLGAAYAKEQRNCLPSCEKEIEDWKFTQSERLQTIILDCLNGGKGK